MGDVERESRGLGVLAGIFFSWTARSSTFGGSGDGGSESFPFTEARSNSGESSAPSVWGRDSGIADDDVGGDDVFDDPNCSKELAHQKSEISFSILGNVRSNICQEVRDTTKTGAGASPGQ